ncbi:MAG: phenylacetate--CoA ligase [Desulfovibrionaceae bacterium]|nr:phenylacetate--CoA ligase [Desulfovibrionaceae bacterium]MBF0512572.1 phenylacetate--CoA ligase [Desulfovibrionaceae bacterium]
MYFEAKCETMAREDLEQLQLERLQSVLTRVARNVPYYRKKFDALGIDPDDFRDLSDVARLPFTDKGVLQDNYPYGLFAVPLREVVRLHASPGSAGTPVVVGYTVNDVKRWSDLTARVLAAGGATRDDVVQIAFDYGLFTGGLGFHEGAQRLGAAVIPASGGNSRRQVMIMQDYKTTVLACTPSYALHLAGVMDEMGINANSLSLRFGLFGGEPLSAAMRLEIESRLKLTATQNYGPTEVMGPGVAGECEARGGMHLNEDHFLAEIVDPATGKALPVGETGELVLTSLTKDAFPVIRYRTGDLTRLLPGECPCGRTFARLDSTLGRADDMLLIRGVPVFPGTIEAALSQMPGGAPEYRVIVEREGALDTATVLIETSEDIFFDQMRRQKEFVDSIKRKLRSSAGVAFEVRLVERCDAASGAAKVIDKRLLT